MKLDEKKKLSSLSINTNTNTNINLCNAIKTQYLSPAQCDAAELLD